MTASPKDTEKMATLGRMTRGLVHDFNNSLASIMGYAEFLIADLPEDSEEHLFANNIRQAGMQMQDLIEQIRALALEKGQGKDVTLNLVKDIEQLADRFTADLPLNQTITVQTDCREAILSLPAHQSRTLFSNLIKNAIESLGADTGNVTVHLSQTTSPIIDTGDYDNSLPLLLVEKTDGPLFRIDITDTGCGMDELVLQLAIEPHFTTKPAGLAHGMGFPVVYGIINYLEGGLTISSSPQKGTCVSIILPVDKISTNESVSEENNTTPPQNILLIEDRDMLRHTLETMLQREKHTVVSTADGLTALDMLRENPKRFDMIVTDFTMPAINGKDLITEVREDFPNMPMIVISGDSGHLGTIQNNPAQKKTYIVSKPVSLPELQKTINAAIKANA